YSAVALIAIGKLPDSPIASTERDTMKPTMDGAAVTPNTPSTATAAAPMCTEAACSSAPSDQTVMATTKADLVPILSTTRPANSMDTAYTNWKMALMLA